MPEILSSIRGKRVGLDADGNLIINGDIASTLGGTQAVTGAKTFSDARVPVTTASTAAAMTNQGITTLGTTGTKTYQVTAPAAGARKVITTTSTTTKIKTVKASTGGAVTFDGVNWIAKFDANKETLEIVGLSATRWAIVANTGSVGLSTV